MARRKQQPKPKGMPSKKPSKSPRNKSGIPAVTYNKKKTY